MLRDLYPTCCPISQIIIGMFMLLFLMSSIGAFTTSAWTSMYVNRMAYLMPWDNDNYYEHDKFVWVGIAHFVTAFILYGFLIPISLYVSIEIVKREQPRENKRIPPKASSSCVTVRGFYIFTCPMQDTERAGFSIGSPARSTVGFGTSKGVAADVIERCERDAQIHTILSDKTGTLTQNKMELFKVGLNADMKEKLLRNRCVRNRGLTPLVHRVRIQNAMIQRWSCAPGDHRGRIVRPRDDGGGAAPSPQGREGGTGYIGFWGQKRG
eukprot:689948-Prorocentrum_minimum.AAC.7